MILTKEEKLGFLNLINGCQFSPKGLEIIEGIAKRITEDGNVYNQQVLVEEGEFILETDEEKKLISDIINGKKTWQLAEKPLRDKIVAEL